MQKKLSKNFNTEADYSPLKDSTVSSLKKEIYELKDTEHGFLKLNDEMSKIESKYAMLLDDKERIQHEHKIKVDINKKNVSDLRGDMDNLRLQIYKVTVQIEDITRQNTTIKRMCQNREGQINQLMASNQQVERSNDLQQQQNSFFMSQLRQLKQQQKNHESEVERINKIMDESIMSQKQLEKEIKQLESTNNKLEIVYQQSQRDHLSLVEEMKTKEESIESSSNQLSELTNQNENIKGQTSILEKQCDRTQNQYQELKRNLDTFIAKNRELTMKLKSLQNTMRLTEGDLDQSMDKRQQLRKAHLELANQNKVLNAEIDKCLISILEYEKTNKDLQEEVENYIKCDQQARAMLNRKENMRHLLNQVSHKLHKTQEQIAHLR